jgi:hypothetical protein
MKRKQILINGILLILLVSCVTKDYWGLSSHGNIKSIEISNQVSQAFIDTDSLHVIIELPGGIDRSNLEIKCLKLFSFAKSDKNIVVKLV